MVQATIRTIGYEGALIDDFVALLVSEGITCLVDVREIASSRRKGFSKSQLSARLRSAGIDYLHLRSLGDPKEGRMAARRGDYRLFEQVYRRHLKTSQAEDAISDVVTRAERDVVCLLCFERDPKTCHRNIVVEEVSKRGQFKVEHLGVPQGFADGLETKHTSRSGESGHPS